MRKGRSSSISPCARKPKSPQPRNNERQQHVGRIGGPCGDGCPWQGKEFLPTVRRFADRHKAAPERTEKAHLTQNQLHELLESDQIRVLVEGAEERGYLEPAELEALVLEHELNDQDVEEVTREFERIGLEVRQPAAEGDAEPE